jgi:predicted enzyme involved in methoxymalonyl-ACP biosynthesis
MLADLEADAIVRSRDCWLLRVSDRLADFGASGVIIVRAEDMVIKAMSLSCTMLGKQVEYALSRR